MKRNFKVIKQDKNLSHLSDADIDKLYSTYIEMDGKHQNFKGSKREYCSTVAGMIKEWLKEVVDKNGGIRDKSLIGGKGRRLGIEKVVTDKEKDIAKLRFKITKLKNDKSGIKQLKSTIPEKIEKLNVEIKNLRDTYVEPKLTKENKKILDKVTKLDVAITSLQKPYEEIEDSYFKIKTLFEKAIPSLKPLVEIKLKPIEEEYNKQRSVIEPLIQERDELLLLPLVQRKRIDDNINEIFEKINDVRTKLEEDKKTFNKQMSGFKKKKMLNNPDVVGWKKAAEEDMGYREKELEKYKKLWNDQREYYKTLLPIDPEKLRSKEELTSEETTLKQRKKELKKKIIKLEAEKTLKESDLPNVEKEKEEALKKLEAEKKEKFKTHTKSLYSGLPAEIKTDEMLDEAYKYRRVINMLLGYKLYEPPASREQNKVTATKNFLRALPFKQLMEITPEGYKQRVEFLNQINRGGSGLKNSNGSFITWTSAVEESFRTESFVFWTLLARNVKDKQKNVYSFELLGKIFSRALYFDPVDFKTSYFTGDSKGVITTSVEATEGIPKNAVVSVRKIFAILEESAYLNSSRGVSFNNPNIIFTFYRSNKKMENYTHITNEFGGKLPYEMLLKYDLSKLLTPGPLFEELKGHIARCKMMSHSDKNDYMSSTAVSTTIEKILKNHYNDTNFCFTNPQDHRTVSLPVGPRAGVAPAVETQLASDFEIVGYSRDIFGEIENPTVKNYSDIYARKDPKVIHYTGSRIDRFVFKSIIPPTAVIKDIVIEDDDDDDSNDITVLSTSEDSERKDPEGELLESKDSEDSEDTPPVTGTPPPPQANEGKGKPSKGSGKPKAYIKKIIKYYC